MSSIRLKCPSCKTLLAMDRPPMTVDRRIACPNCHRPLRLRAKSPEIIDPKSLGVGPTHTADADAAGPVTMEGIVVQTQVSMNWGDDFTILKKIGAGNMGAVYLAWQKSKKRQVALKVLFPHLSHNRMYVERFEREAEAMTRLNHPNIVAFYGMGRENASPYFAMEFVQGFNTSAVQAELGGIFTVGDALFLTVEVANALRYVHGHNVIHRDIKPDNIMLTDLGRVKVTDLGLAKPMDQDDSLTETGISLGTPHFMAPEQARDAKNADHRSDLYALGCTLYYWLTAQTPFAADSTMALLEEKQRGLFPSARKLNNEITPQLDLIIDRLLAKDPKTRIQNCDELLEALDRLDLAHDFLHFNVLQVCRVLKPTTAAPTAGSRLEVLLVHDSHSVATLAQDALSRCDVPVNVTVRRSAEDAAVQLRNKDVTIGLILLGVDLDPVTDQSFLDALHSRQETDFPAMAILGNPAVEGALFNHDVAARIHLRSLDDLAPLKSLVQSVYNLQ